MSETITKEEINKKIYEVRGQKVMLASDLAKLFEYKNGTKEINKIVNRNKEKFSRDNYFQLTKEENLNLRSQNEDSRSQSGTSSFNNYGGVRYLPYVFTSNGIENLSHILKSEKAREISKIILTIFNEEKQYKIIKKVPEIQVENVRAMIYELNGIPIMLDNDLANLYGCKNGAKTINQAVKRNLERFPNNFYFQLNLNEYNNLRSQVGTANLNMTRSLPYVFTEQGVYMLASILKTENAVKVNIALIRAFTLMRHYLENNQNLIISILIIALKKKKLKNH